MRTFRLEREIWIPQPREEVFDFFGDARNLERITPPWLRFQILPPVPEVVERGTLLNYKLRLRGMPIRWRTEITCWEPPVRFVDEQRRGPYRLWRHEHRFEPRDAGTVCLDRVDYAVPGGALVERLFVRGQLRRIFDYRAEALREVFIANGGAEWNQIRQAGGGQFS
jgi:ligand-binding SRPBCC domain-containing protein